MTLDEMKLEITKLSPKAGDLLLFRYPQGLPHSAKNSLMECVADCARSLESPPYFIMLPEGFAIESLRDEELAAAGLCRIDAPAIVEKS